MKGTIPGLLIWLFLFAPPAVLGQWAYSTNADGSIYTFSTNADGSANIGAYSGPPWTVIIPSSINGLTVTSIGDYAFYDSINLTSVTIPASIENIGEGAFEDCLNLTNAVIADGVTNIGDYAFTTCTSLLSVAIPASVTNIGEYAFAVCSSLTNITMANGVTNLGEGAFWLCPGLTSVTIPASVTGIGSFAFAECPGLTNIYFAGNPPIVGQAVFDDDTDATISYSPCASGWSSPFAGLSTAKEVPYPFSYVAYEGAITITGFIGSCQNLIIPPNIAGLPVVNIGDKAFYGDSLTSVTIPANVTNIGEEAFFKCTSLTGVTIPASVTYIGPAAFQGCLSLTSIYCEGNPPALGDDVFGVYYNKSSNEVPPTIYFLPCTTGWSNTFGGVPTAEQLVSTVFDYATNAGAITITGYTGPCQTLTIPIDIGGLPVTGIGEEAFFDCTNLTGVTILASLTSIGEEAFEDCFNLTNVLIPSSITNIGSMAFAECTNLEDAYFTSEPPSVGPAAFNDDNKLTIHYPACTNGWSNTFSGVPSLALSAQTQFGYTINAGSITITGYFGSCEVVGIPLTINGLPVVSIGEDAFVNYDNIETMAIPSSVTNIARSAFASCNSLANLIIANGVTSIGGGAFVGCGNLHNVSIPSSVTSIGEQAFFECTGLTNITIPDGLTSIGPNAFSDCVRLRNVSIPGSVTSIGQEAFLYCLNLTNTTIRASFTNIGEGVFNECTGLTSVNFTNGATTIGVDMFEDCSSLISVTIPASVTNIGQSAFFGCSSLSAITVDPQNTFYKSVNDVLFNKSQTMLIQYPALQTNRFYVIPDSVTSVGDVAFANCADLTNLTFPASVTNIGVEAIYECSGLSSIYFEGNAPALGAAAFDFVSPIYYYLPGTTGWSSFTAEFGIAPVLWNPLIQAEGFNFGEREKTFGFNITGTNNFTVVVEACTNLASPNWIPLQTITLADGSFQFSDPQWTNYPSRFYSLAMP